MPVSGPMSYSVKVYDIHRDKEGRVVSAPIVIGHARFETLRGVQAWIVAVAADVAAAEYEISRDSIEQLSNGKVDPLRIGAVTIGLHDKGKIV